MIGSLSLKPVILWVSFQVFVFLSMLDYMLEVIFPCAFNTFHYLPLRETLETLALFGLAEQGPLPALCNKPISKQVLQ